MSSGAGLVTQHRLSPIAEHCSDVITLTDTNRCLRYANPAFERVLGRPRGLYLGRPVWHFVHPGDRERFGGALDVLMTGPEKSIRFECRLVHGDGTLRHFAVNQISCLDDEEIGGFLGIALDITERIRIEEYWEHRATHDLLTGLPNRGLFFERLPDVLARAKATGTTITLFFIDLDGFKAVNDRYGHDVGDKVLVEFAQRLECSAWASDNLARLGGDEFVFIASGIREADAPAIGELLRSLLTRPFLFDGLNVEVDASVGFASSTGHTDAGDLLHAADRHMYRVKRSNARQVDRANNR